MGSVQPEPDTEAGSMATWPCPCAFKEEGPIVWPSPNNLTWDLVIYWMFFEWIQDLWKKKGADLCKGSARPRASPPSLGHTGASSLAINPVLIISEQGSASGHQRPLERRNQHSHCKGSSAWELLGAPSDSLRTPRKLFTLQQIKSPFFLKQWEIQ